MGEFENQINYANQEWNRGYELILTDRCDKARCMAWLCTYTSNYYNKQRTYLLVPASIVSWSLNIFGMITTYLGKEKISEPLVILIISLGNFIVATLTTIAEQGKAGDKVELFNQTSRDYNLIASEIKHQIMLPPNNRKPVMKILIETEKKYNDLMKSSPNIPEPITKDFIKRNAKNNNFIKVSKPEILVELSPSSDLLYGKNKSVLQEMNTSFKKLTKKSKIQKEDLIDTPKEHTIINLDEIVKNEIIQE